MNETQQLEYDFFMRMKSLSERRMFEFAQFADSESDLGKMFQQAVEDVNRCELWAKMIREGTLVLTEVTK